MTTLTPESWALRCQNAGLPAPTAAQVALIQQYPCLADLVAPVPQQTAHGAAADAFRRMFTAPGLN